MEGKSGQLTACKWPERELESTFGGLCPSCWAGRQGEKLMTKQRQTNLDTVISKGRSRN